MAEATGTGQGLPFDTEQVTEALGAIREEVMAAAQRLGQELQLEQRMRQNPMAVLGMAAGAGFLLGGGLWPMLRPIVRSALRGAMSPSNLLAIAAALGALRAAEGQARPGPASAG